MPTSARLSVKTARMSRLLLTLLLVLVSVVIPAASPTVHATTLAIITTSDENNGCDAHGCSLREAIIAANSNGTPDILVLPPGTYTLSIDGAGEDAAASGDLDIREDLTVQGTSAGRVVIDANGIDRVLHVLNGATLTLEHITITGGSTPTSGNPDEQHGGGIGIGAYSTLTVHNSLIVGNTATGEGGGIATLSDRSMLVVEHSTIEHNRALDGGGIVNVGRGQVTIRNGSLIRNNTSDGTDLGGGGLHNRGGGRMELFDSAVLDNEAEKGDGGGIANTDPGSTLIIDASTVTGNTAINGNGGGLFTDASSPENTVTIRNGTRINENKAGRGGGIASDGGNMTLTDSTISANEAKRGGGIASDGSSITLTDSTISANEAEHGGGIANEMSIITLQRSVVTNNYASSDGGGIANAHGEIIALDRSSIRKNEADGNGGGIANRDGGVVTIQDESDISENKADANTDDSGSGGGIYSSDPLSSISVEASLIHGNTANYGGGIYNIASSTVDLLKSTVGGNSLVGFAKDGGGIYNSGVGSTVTIRASTIGYDGAGHLIGPWHFNSAARGGGIFNTDSGEVQVIASTLAYNEASQSGSGIYNDAALEITSSTISNNHAAFTGNSTSGGGLYNTDVGTAIIAHSTIVDNTTADSTDGIFRGSGDSIYNSSGGNVQVQHTIIAKVDEPVWNDECSGPITSQGYNLDSDGTCFDGAVTGDIPATDPMLLPFHNYDSATATYAPADDSSVIDSGDSSLANPPATDQHGFARVANATIDIGAVEYQDICFAQALDASDTLISQHQSTDIQALRDAIAAPDAATVRVAGFCPSFDPMSREAVTLAKDLTLIGGYPYDGSFTTRDLEAHPTVLSLHAPDHIDRDEDVMLVAKDAAGNPVNVTLDGLMIIGEDFNDDHWDIHKGNGIRNAGNNVTLNHVTIILQMDESSDSWDGITNQEGIMVLNNSIVRGRHSIYLEPSIGIWNDAGTITLNESSVYSSGAYGIMNEDGTLLVNNSIVFANHDAGVLNYQGNVTLTDSHIRDNSRNGIVNDGGSSATTTLVNSTVSRNGSRGIVVKGGTVTLEDSHVRYHETDENGAGIFAEGAVVVRGGSFSHNHTSRSGGGIFVLPTGSLMVDAGAVISHNHADGSGGGIVHNGGGLTLTASSVSYNSAGEQGGGIARDAAGSITTISDSTIHHNHAGTDGGGIALGLDTTLDVSTSSIANNSAGRAGGGIAVAGSVLTMDQSSISDNRAARGGGIDNQNVVTLDPNGDDDGDGIANEVECSSYDTVQNIKAGCEDSDGDGLPDYLEPGDQANNPDDDGDGIPTWWECSYEFASPLEPIDSICGDTDGDGTLDYLDDNDDGDEFKTEDECNYPFSADDPNVKDTANDPRHAGTGMCSDDDMDNIPDYLDNLDDQDIIQEEVPDDTHVFVRLLDPNIRPTDGTEFPEEGVVISDPSETFFEAWAWDDRIAGAPMAATNGISITQVHLTLRSPSGGIVRSVSDTEAPYCVFGQTGGACKNWENGDFFVPFDEAEEGEYTLTAQASSGSVPSHIVTRKFILLQPEVENIIIDVPDLRFDDDSIAVTNSTISYNSATGNGGGIAHTTDNTSASISNSTISGNSAGGDGGGSHTSGSQGRIAHSTVAFNVADGSGSGVFNASDSLLTLDHTLLTENHPGADCSGLLTSAGYNLASDASCDLAAAGDLTSANARLGPLQYHGGTNFTHPLLEGSTAVDAGDPAYSGPLTTDQRGSGFPRVAGARIDIGAFEQTPPTLTIRTAGDGSGSVISDPGGIDCGAACAHGFAQGSTVKLIARPAPGTTFAGWSGGCSGTGAEISVTMERSTTCIATFEVNRALTATPTKPAPTATLDDEDPTATPEDPTSSENTTTPEPERSVTPTPSMDATPTTKPDPGETLPPADDDDTSVDEPGTPDKPDDSDGDGNDIVPDDETTPEPVPAEERFATYLPIVQR